MSRQGKAGGILKNTFTVGAFTAFSRVLGLVREMLQSRMIGAGMEQSAFTLAFAIPNMARKLFGEGALTAAFVPVFAKTLNGDGGAGDPARRLEAAAKLARAVMTMVLLMLGSIVLLAMGGLEIVVKFREQLGLQVQDLSRTLPFPQARTCNILLYSYNSHCGNASYHLDNTAYSIPPLMICESPQKALPYSYKSYFQHYYASC